MATKTKKSEKKSDIMKSVKSFLSQSFLALVQDYFHNMQKKTEEFVKKLVKKTVDFMYFSIFMLFAVLFILIAIVFLINEYLGLSFGWTFLIIGLIFLILSLIFRISLNKK